MDKFSPIKIADNVGIFNPNNWVDDPDYVYRLQCGNSHVEALLDYEDYVYFSKWKWASKISKGGKKVYFYRTSCYYEDGAKINFSIYLHKVVHERTGAIPPTSDHNIVDHRNGNSLDCRRTNLRWVTPSMNRKNVNGLYPYDLIEDQPVQGERNAV